MLCSQLLYTHAMQSEISIQDNVGERKVHTETECR